MSGLSWLARRQLDRAIARGDLADFEGKGKPFGPELWADPSEGEWEQSFRMLRQADLAPRWIELDKEIRQRSKTLRGWLREALNLHHESDSGWRRVRVQAEAEIEDINKQVQLRNQLAPISVRPRFHLKLESEITKLRDQESKSRP
ncbi:MAG: DnaJ family domain-containing protein [Anaerolineales bacterium]